VLRLLLVGNLVPRQQMVQKCRLRTCQVYRFSDGAIFVSAALQTTRHTSPTIYSQCRSVSNFTVLHEMGNYYYHKTQSLRKYLQGGHVPKLHSVNILSQ
jgi:hypothetical protein